MFQRGAEIPGDSPRLTGDAPLVRVMRLTDVDEVEAARPELQAIIRAWVRRPRRLTALRR
jgi:hypothetical protein